MFIILPTSQVKVKVKRTKTGIFVIRNLSFSSDLVENLSQMGYSGSSEQYKDRGTRLYAKLRYPWDQGLGVTKTTITKTPDEGEGRCGTERKDTETPNGGIVNRYRKSDDIGPRLILLWTKRMESLITLLVSPTNCTTFTKLFLLLDAVYPIILLILRT